MKIALIGNGKMGQTIQTLAKNDSSIEITAVLGKDDEITPTTLANARVAIDFTHPTQAINNLEKLAGAGLNVVMGTTGWFDDLEKARQIVEKSGIGFIYSPNFSIGVNLFWKTIEQAAKDFSKFEEFDVFGHELHHTEKADSPSGTAIIAAEKILENYPSKTNISYETQHGKINPETLHFSSTRGGHIHGTHTIYFDSPADTIEITHRARSREGFANGALRCAKWLENKTGFFTFDDYLTSLI